MSPDLMAMPSEVLVHIFAELNITERLYLSRVSFVGYQAFSSAIAETGLGISHAEAGIR